MSHGSFAQTSVISRQHAHIGGVFAWRNTCTHHRRTCRSHQSDLLVSTNQACLPLLHLPLRNDPRLTGQGKLPVPLRSSSPCGPFRLCSVRLTDSRLRVGTGASWVATAATFSAQGWLRKNLIAPQWRRITIGEESRTNTQSFSPAPGKRFWVQERKPSQATGSASWVIHVTYALGGVSRHGMQGADLEWRQSRGARFARSCSLLAPWFLPLSSFEKVGR